MYFSRALPNSSAEENYPEGFLLNDRNGDLVNVGKMSLYKKTKRKRLEMG